MYLLNAGLRGVGHDSIREDALVNKLRDVILVGREPTRYDRARAAAYNVRCWLLGLPYRAEIR